MSTGLCRATKCGGFVRLPTKGRESAVLAFNETALVLVHRKLPRLATIPWIVTCVGMVLPATTLVRRFPCLGNDGRQDCDFRPGWPCLGALRGAAPPSGREFPGCMQVRLQLNPLGECSTPWSQEPWLGVWKHVLQGSRSRQAEQPISERKAYRAPISLFDFSLRSPGARGC